MPVSGGRASSAPRERSPLQNRVPSGDDGGDEQEDRVHCCLLNESSSLLLIVERAWFKSTIPPPRERSPNLPLIPLVNGEDGTENGAGELRGQDIHVNLVPEAAVVPAALPPAPYLAKADLLVAPAARTVVLEHHQHHAVQTERGEGVVNEEPHRLRAIAAAPRVRLADHDADHRAPVSEVHFV